MRSISISLRRYLFPPLHEEGPLFLTFFAFPTLAFVGLTVLVSLYWLPLALVGAMLTVWCWYFFRDPVRYVPSRPGLIVSPASGIVQLIGPVVPPPEFGLGEEPLQRVSVFMSVFDCHVNRVPLGGVVRKTIYHPGKFLNADLDKASEDNERQSVVVQTAEGPSIAFVQIAGLVARRIRCDLKEGQSVETGERFGLIRFGSRLDIYLPPGVSPLVVLGQAAISGETVLADLTSREPARDEKAL